MKKFLFPFLLSLFFLLLNPLSVYARWAAQTDTNGQGGYSVSGTGNEAFCRGDRDYSTFLSSIVGYDDFTEYWKDILYRYSANVCHYSDIDSLKNRIDKTREQLRKAFYVCADTSTLKKTYYRLEAELFFLRKYVDADNGQFLITSDRDLENSLRDYFVLNKGFFSSEEVTELVKSFKSRYGSRLQTYKNCTDPSWQNLSNKWEELRENVVGMAPSIQQAGKSIGAKWDRLENTCVFCGKEFFGGFLDMRLNGVPPLQGLQQIGQELAKNKPDGYTFDELQTAQNVSDTEYNDAALQEQYMAQYDQLYRESSDQFTAGLTQRLDTLNNIITRTFPFQNQTIQCLKTVNNKQC